MDLWRGVFIARLCPSGYQFCKSVCATWTVGEVNIRTTNNRFQQLSGFIENTLMCWSYQVSVLKFPFWFKITLVVLVEFKSSFLMFYPRKWMDFIYMWAERTIHRFLLVVWINLWAKQKTVIVISSLINVHLVRTISTCGQSKPVIRGVNSCHSQILGLSSIHVPGQHR